MRDLVNFECTGANVKGDEGAEVCALASFIMGGCKLYFFRPEFVLRGKTSGASGSGPDLRRICPGISVRMELIRASS